MSYKLVDAGYGDFISGLNKAGNAQKGRVHRDLIKPGKHVFDRDVVSYHPTKWHLAVSVAAHILQKDGGPLYKGDLKELPVVAEESAQVARAKQALLLLLQGADAVPSDTLRLNPKYNKAFRYNTCDEAEGHFVGLLKELGNERELEPGMVVVDEHRRPIILHKNPLRENWRETEYFGEPTALTLQGMAVGPVYIPSGSIISIAYEGERDAMEPVVGYKEVVAATFLRLGELTTQQTCRDDIYGPRLDLNAFRITLDQKIEQHDEYAKKLAL